MFWADLDYHKMTVPLLELLPPAVPGPVVWRALPVQGPELSMYSRNGLQLSKPQQTLGILLCHKHDVQQYVMRDK